MATRYASRDGHWRVRPIAYVWPGGKGTVRVELLRLEHDSPTVDGVTVTHPDAANHRYGPEQTSPGWWRIDDVRSVAGLARWGVDLADLELVTEDAEVRAA